MIMPYIYVYIFIYFENNKQRILLNIIQMQHINILNYPILLNYFNHYLDNKVIKISDFCI